MASGTLGLGVLGTTSRALGDPAFRSDPLLVFWSDTSLAFSSDPLTLAGCCQGRGLLNPHGRVAGCRHSVLFVRAQLVQ